jgi:hypothetical protein
MGVGTKRMSRLWFATCANITQYLEALDDAAIMAEYLEWKLPLSMFPGEAFASGKE